MRGQGKRDVDWDIIKKRYMEGTPMRQLAKEYGIGASTICEHAQRHDWKNLAQEITKASERRFAEKIIEKKSSVDVQIYEAVEIAVGKITSGLKAVDRKDASKVRAYVSALKDCKDMGFYRSDMDTAEQLARIKKLEKEASTETQDNTITVVLADEVNEYAD